MNNYYQQSNLGDVCKVINGKAFRQEELLESGKYKVLRVGNFFSNSSWYYSDLELDNDKYCYNNDLLFAWSASFGPRIWKEEKAIYHYHIWRLLPNEEIIDKGYLYYYLLSNTKSMLGSTHGSIMLHMTKSFMEELVISFPRLTDQKRISSLLTDLDRKIELNNRINSELESMAKLIYDYWFVQFDFPDENGKPYKSSGGRMDWSEELKRKIPEGWEVKNVLEVAEWIGGSQPPKSTFKFSQSVGYVRFIQNRDYANDRNLTYIRVSSSNKLCDELDIMMDKYGEAGKTRFGLAGAYNVALSRIKVNLEYGQEYIRKFLESKQIHHYLYNACMASTRSSLNEDILGNLVLVIPKREVLIVYERHQKAILYKILQNRKESEKLSELRDLLLPMLMNGQVTIKNHIT